MAQPDLETVSGLSRDARATIYLALAQDPANGLHFSAFHRRARQMDAWLDQTPLRPQVRSLFSSLLYPGGEFLYFADPQVLCARVPIEDRKSLLTAVTRVLGQRVTLYVDEGAPVDELAGYWGKGGRTQEVRAVLASLARRPGGGNIDIAELLPPFARARVYGYESPDRGLKSCFWTALNFFDPDPKEHIFTPQEIAAELSQNYEPIDPEKARLGDLIAYVHPGGLVLHLMTYIAADIVFSKNGEAHQHPFTLTTLAEMRDTYKDKELIKEVYYRRR
jgi:hypothetical protein